MRSLAERGAAPARNVARPAVLKHRQEQLATSGIEAAVLERDASAAIRYRSLSDTELRSLIHE